MPFFSIILPCYNQSNWLKQSMEAILNQDFSDWEAIIVNDGSTDDSGTLADNFAKNDNRIKVIHQQNQGLSAARNTGVKNAVGSWLNFHDTDDYLLPGCLKQVHKEILINKEFELFQVGHELVDEQNNIIHSNWLTQPNGKFLLQAKIGNPGPPLTFFIQKNTASEAGEFDVELKSAEDWDFWIRVAKMGVERYTIREPWVAYRYSSNSMSRNPWRMYENTVKVIERIPNIDNRILRVSEWNTEMDFDLKEAVKTRFIQCLGLCIMQGKIVEALEYFRREGRIYHFLYKPEEFRHMNSFMTFRHWYRREDVDMVLEKYPELYHQFFKQTYFSESFQQACISSIFEFHQKNQNQFRWGILGKWRNKQIDMNKKSKRFQPELGF